MPQRLASSHLLETEKVSSVVLEAQDWFVRILVYEFLTGGGLLGVEGDPVLGVEGHAGPARSMLAQGAAMRSALVTDLARAGHERITVLQDPRLRLRRIPPGCHVVRVRTLAELHDRLIQLAREHSATFVIAPESEGQLWAACRLVEEGGGRLIGGPSSFVCWAADKSETARRLRAHGVPCPVGQSWDPAGGTPRGTVTFPAIIKPIDGAGSQGVRRVESAKDLEDVAGNGGRVYRLEEWCPGRAASVAALCGPAGVRFLPPFFQRIARSGSFEYRGGWRIMDRQLVARVERLAGDLVPVLRGARGYIGVDLILGPAPDGSQDRVLEINPRLTTSYVGLRRVCIGNLAGAILQVATGQASSIEFNSRGVEFRADGPIDAGQVCNLSVVE